MDGDNLFVNEEDENTQLSPQQDGDSASPTQQVQEEENVPDVDDDPIIRSIPLVHGSLPHRQSQTLHLLQFAGRQKVQNFALQSLKAAVKPTSKVVQLRVPMNTHKFYNEGRSAELGGHIENVSLQGVLTNTDGGLYAGKIIDHDGQLRIVLIPLDSTAQLRPLFKYIDDLDSARHQQARQENHAAETTKLSAVLVLQTASKPSGALNPEGHNNGGVGSCLRHVKRFNEEEWMSLSWFSGEDSSTGKIAHLIANPKTDPVGVTTVLDELLGSV